MALTITFRESVYSTSAATAYATTGTYTPAENSLLIAFVVGSLASSPTDPSSVTGHGVTWAKITLASNTVGGTHAISVWVANSGASPSTTAVTANWGSNRTGAAVIEFEVTGWNVSNPVENAIIQKPVNTATTGTTGTVTLATAKYNDNRPLSFWVHLANEATTPRTNWTETTGADGNYNTPATGAEAQFRSDAFETTASATWTTTINWFGVAIEVQAALELPFPQTEVPIFDKVGVVGY